MAGLLMQQYLRRHSQVYNDHLYNQRSGMWQGGLAQVPISKYLGSASKKSSAFHPGL